MTAFNPVLSFTRTFLYALLAIFFGGCWLFSPLMAQEAAPAAPAAAPAGEAAAAGGTEATTLMDIIKHSGPVVWACMAMSVLVTAFTIEGFLKLRYASLCPAAQLARLRELISYGSYQEAWEFCRANKSFLCTIVAAGLERIGRGKDAVEYTIQETSSQQSVVLKTNVNYLSVIGVVAPMVGLTGTVIGMIKAFKELGSSGIGDPSGLAAAIGEVLVATAAGLIVAIPGFVFFYVFKSKAQTAVMLADSAIFRLFEDIPFDQLAGMRVGESVAAEAAAGYAEGGDTSYAQPQG
jgi:biopolymer transport protein ExbB